MIACESDPEASYKTSCTYKNQSSYTIEVTIESGMGWSPSQFTLQPGESQLVGTSKEVALILATYTNDQLVTYITYSCYAEHNI